MANTITNRVLHGASGTKYVELLYHINSDGTNETDAVVYDPANYDGNMYAAVDYISATGSDCLVVLEWDQTTDSPIAALNPSSSPEIDLRCSAGISNPMGTGATGKINITTTGLAAGEQFTLIIRLKK
jgi:hypothetical protein